MIKKIQTGITALPLVILIGGIVLEATIAFALVAYYLYESGGGTKFSNDALLLSRTGINDAVFKLTKNSNFFTDSRTDYSIPVSGTNRGVSVIVCRNSVTGGSPCSNLINPPNNAILYEITSFGKSSNKNRELRVKVSVNSSGQIAMESVKELPYRFFDDLTNGLIGYWNLNENGGSIARDTNRIIPPNDAAITNPSWVAGKTGSALNFNGGSTYAETPEITDPGPYGGLQQGSVSAWVKVDRLNSNCDFWGFGSNVASYSSTEGSLSWMKWNLGDDFQKFGGNCDADKNKLHIIQEWKPKCSSSSAPHAYLRTINPININGDTNWHLVVFTTDGTNAKIYWDGIEQPAFFWPADPVECAGSAGDFLADINYMGDPWYKHFFDIGVLHHGAIFDNYYNGVIDDVRIYNRALSPSEISQIYNS